MDRTRYYLPLCFTDQGIRKMDKNLTIFLKDLDKEIKNVLSDTNTKIQGTVASMKDALLRPKAQQGTPKITGHLRANWIVSIDNEFLGVAGSQNNVSTSERERAWNEFLGIDDLYLRNNIYLNNNVYYGPWVNSGPKGQHFRESAIQVGEGYLNAHRK